MNLWTIDNVTVYNGYIDKVTGLEYYVPTFIRKASLIISKGRNISTSGITDADTVKLYIQVKDLPKPYKDPIAWSKLTADDKEKYITFNSIYDFFVKGDTTTEEIKESNFFEYMMENKDHVYKITTVDAFMNVMPHYEIGGR